MAKSEADHALRLVKGYKLSYPLYIDVEEASQSGIAKDVVKVFLRSREGRWLHAWRVC